MTSTVALEIRTATHDDAPAMMRVRREAILAKAATHCDQTVLEDWVAAGYPGRIVKKISDPDYVALIAEPGAR